MKKLQLALMFFLLWNAVFSQIYLPVTPVGQGVNFTRVNPEIALHLPVLPDLTSSHTNITNPQIGYYEGNVYYYDATDGWREISGTATTPTLSEVLEAGNTMDDNVIKTTSGHIVFTNNSDYGILEVDASGGLQADDAFGNEAIRFNDRQLTQGGFTMLDWSNGSKIVVPNRIFEVNSSSGAYVQLGANDVLFSNDDGTFTGVVAGTRMTANRTIFLPDVNGNLAEGITDGTHTTHADVNGMLDISSFTFPAPSLQAVTDIGFSTTNPVVSSYGLFASTTSGDVQVGAANTSGGAVNAIAQVISGVPSFQLTTHTAGSSLIEASNLTASRTFQLPNSSGTLALSVNGNTADASGNITVSTGSGVTLKTNGTNNGSQSVLNLTSGTEGTSFADNGTGTITLTSPITKVQSTATLYTSSLLASPGGSYNIILGTYANTGASTTNSTYNVILGYNAGSYATNVTRAVFIGKTAGYNAPAAYYSNFIGTGAGYNLTDGSYSNIFGYATGYYITGGYNPGYNNIMIGTNVTLPSSTSNAINLGDVLYGINTFYDPVSDVSHGPTYTPTSNGSIGIGVVTPGNRLEVANNSSLATGKSGLRLGITSSTTTLGSAPNVLGVDANGDVGVYTTPSGGGGSGTTTNSLTVNNSGTGDASGFTFNGSAAKTISYNSIGAQPQLSGTGFVKISGTTISYDNSTYLTSYTETDPVVKAINGIVKSNGTTISAAVAGTDYITASSTNTFTNKSGNISQWTNDAGYLTSVSDAVADGSTKGIATFTASDFNSASGVISIDYTNGQSASTSNKGFLTSTDWNIFNGKQNALSDASNIVYKDVANTYTAGSKQTFGSSSTTAAINFAGVTANPSSLSAGDFWYRSDETKFHYWDGTVDRKLVAESLSQTITNKTIAAGSNTITGIAAANMTYPSYSFVANNTGSSATPSNFVYEDLGEQTYSGTISNFVATANPSSPSAVYHWTQIGKRVDVWFWLQFASGGTSVQGFSATIPSDVPNPVERGGYTSVGDIEAIGVANSGGTSSTTQTGGKIAIVKIGTGSYGWTFTLPSNNGKYVQAHITYEAQ